MSLKPVCVLIILLIFCNERNNVSSQISPYGTTSDVFGCPGNVFCDANQKYRNIDGTCNNLANTRWGSTGILFRRFLPAQYGNGDTPRGTGITPPLPVPRKLTAALTITPVTTTSNPLSLLSMLWGQFLSHDVNFTPFFDDVICCSNGFFVSTSDPRCLALNVEGDPFFGQFGFHCIDLTRSIPADPLCQTNSREQVNSRTAFIDLSLVYGLTEQETLNLRTGIKGQMKIGAGVETISSCPADVTSSCPFNFLFESTSSTFLTGDFRAGQNPALTSFHHFFIRIHNYFAFQLSILHPDPDGYTDEILFQEARRICIALEQHITYNEYLPAVLGQAIADSYDLLPLNGNQFFTSYDGTLDPSLHSVFSTAAFRFGHSQIEDFFHLLNGIDVELSHSFSVHPITLTFGTYPSDFMKGIASQVAAKVDHFIAQSVTNTLYAAPPFESGSDLSSRNIARGRDHGLQSYNEWRRFCGLEVFSSFSQLSGTITPEAINVFTLQYASVDDIDLFPAGISELPLGDGVVGPTFSCILGQQFRNLKYGDRFFYEGNQIYLFSNDQLHAIRKTTLASLICAFTNTESIQPSVMLSIGTNNKIKNCKTQQSPLITNFNTLWH